jgi:hypothetical protein
MGPTRQLIDQLYREKVERARQQSPQEKFRDGLQLFDLACRVMIDGIRMQNPKADDATVMALLRQRLSLLDQLEAAP